MYKANLEIDFVLILLVPNVKFKRNKFIYVLCNTFNF
jgi:hypothetical protein